MGKAKQGAAHNAFLNASKAAVASVKHTNGTFLLVMKWKGAGSAAKPLPYYYSNLLCPEKASYP